MIRPGVLPAVRDTSVIQMGKAENRTGRRLTFLMGTMTLWMTRDGPLNASRSSPRSIVRPIVTFQQVSPEPVYHHVIFPFGNFPFHFFKSKINHIMVM